MAFWRLGADQVSIAVKVQPKSRRPGLHGIVGDRLRIGVTEAAEDGRANRAACAALAEMLDVPPSTVSVLHGASSREKTLVIAAPSAQTLERLATL
jgi:uncharacterized protein (TIGR00251 family)